MHSIYLSRNKSRSGDRSYSADIGESMRLGTALTEDDTFPLTLQAYLGHR